MLNELKISHQKEKDLVGQCQEFKKSMNENANKLKAVMQIASDDSQTITKLQQELEEAKNILMVQREKDEQCTKKIEDLTKMWKKLEELTKQQQELNSEKIKKYEEIMSEKNGIESELNDLNEQNKNLILELEELKGRSQETVDMEFHLQREYHEIQQKVNEDFIQINKNDERISESKYELSQAREKKELTQIQFEEERDLLKMEEINLEKVFNKVKKVMLNFKHLKKSNILQEEDIEKQKEMIQHNKQENNELIQLKLELEQNVQQLQKENNLSKLKSKQLKVISNTIVMEDQKVLEELEKIEQDIIIRKTEFNDYQNKLKILEEVSGPQEKELQMVYNSHLQIKRTYKGLVINNSELVNQIRDILQMNQNTMNQLQPCQLEINTKSRQLKLEKQEKERIIKDINLYHCKIQKVKEDLLLKDNIINEVQKKSLETENTLENLQEQYEKVRIERNKYTKQLKETQDEISELKRKINITINSLDQMQEEYQVKNQQTFLEFQKAENLMKTFQNLTKMIEKLVNFNILKDQNIKNFANSIGKLKGIRKETSVYIDQQENKTEKIIIERDMFITQLIGLNSQIQQLKESLQKQYDTYVSGQKEFIKKENELDYLNVLIKDLQNEIIINQKKAQKIFKYKDKIEIFNSKLVSEKLKVKALSEELENPINIQRWRSVGTTEEDVYELMQNIQDVQKKLIVKTEQLIQEDLKITSQKRTMDNFKEIYEQNPGILDAIRLAETQKQLRKKIRKMKACAAELNLYKFKINEGKENKEEIKRQTEMYKKKLFMRFHQSKSKFKIRSRSKIMMNKLITSNDI